MIHRHKIDIEWLKNGQRGPYADTDRLFNIRLDWNAKEPMVRRLAAVLGGDGMKVWPKNDSSKPWHAPYFEQLVQQPGGEWRVHIVVPFTD